MLDLGGWSLWRPDPHQIGTPVAVDAFCGVGRKPMALGAGAAPEGQRRRREVEVFASLHEPLPVASQHF